jgi:GMP synthase (glutamine-hydrolysing)
MTPRILLIQVRNPDDPMLGHELACFAKRCELPLEHFSAHNVVASPLPGGIKKYDAVMVGGSGDYSVVHKPFPALEATMEFIATTISRRVPFFGSCMGFQMISKALGGTVVTDEANREVGTYDLTLTEDGKDDPLFGKMPGVFPGHLGHTDRVEIPPPGARHLASSEKCPYQAFRIGDGPAYCTQFHPELDKKSNQERYDFYVEQHRVTGGKLGYPATDAKFLAMDPPVNLLKEFLDAFV